MDGRYVYVLPDYFTFNGRRQVVSMLGFFHGMVKMVASNYKRYFVAYYHLSNVR
jgi:hypothetical protein